MSSRFVKRYNKYYESKKAENITEDSYWTKEELHPSFWKNNKFDSTVRKKLLRIANEFYESTGFEAPIEDIQLTGSLANYNYTPFSDLDVHVLIDFKSLGDEKIVKDAADGKRFVWNMRHNIYIRGFEVEVYIQDIHEPHHKNGLYSILDNKWIAEPTYEEPDTDPADVKRKAEDFMKEVDVLGAELEKAPTEKAEDIYDRLSELRSKIVKMRRSALQGGRGLFSVENLAFKELRNNGYMGKLIDLAHQAYDKIFIE